MRRFPALILIFLGALVSQAHIRKEFVWTNSAWNLTNKTRYVYDGMFAVMENDTNDYPVVFYQRGLDVSGTLQGAGGIGGVLARLDGSTFANYHADGNGNVTALVDGSENVSAHYSYDPFGNVLSASGLMALINSYQFSSKENYRGIDLFEARPYFPNLGRFGQADPIGLAGGFNLHQFVGNDPVNMIDFFGEAGFPSVVHIVVPNYKLLNPR